LKQARIFEPLFGVSLADNCLAQLHKLDMAATEQGRGGLFNLRVSGFGCV